MSLPIISLKDAQDIQKAFSDLRWDRDALAIKCDALQRELDTANQAVDTLRTQLQ